MFQRSAKAKRMLSFNESQAISLVIITQEALTLRKSTRQGVGAVEDDDLCYHLARGSDTIGLTHEGRSQYI